MQWFTFSGFVSYRFLVRLFLIHLLWEHRLRLFSHSTSDLEWMPSIFSHHLFVFTKCNRIALTTIFLPLSALHGSRLCRIRCIFLWSTQVCDGLSWNRLQGMHHRMCSIPGGRRRNGSTGSLPLETHESPTMLRYTAWTCFEDISSRLSLESVRFYDTNSSVCNPCPSATCCSSVAITFCSQHWFLLVSFYNRNINCFLNDRRSQSPSSSPTCITRHASPAVRQHLWPVIDQKKLFPGFISNTPVIRLRSSSSPIRRWSNVCSISSSVLCDTRLQSLLCRNNCRPASIRSREALQTMGCRAGLLVMWQQVKQA